jgi:pimeloyl-ACP methyl ester carboxylesterase
MQRENFKLKDGRNFEYSSNELESSEAVILHAGTIQDISGWSTWFDYFTSNGVRAVAIGRSGYVNSSKKPGRITIDIANDVSELANHLGINRMVNFGLSGGGQHAIATGLDPKSVGVVTSGSLAPFAELGNDFYLGMQQADIDEYGDALRNDFDSLIGKFKEWIGLSTSKMLENPNLSSNDRRCLESQSAKELFDSCQITMNAGWDWVEDDYSSYLKPWGFDPRDVKVPVVIFQGGLDLNVPPVHGKWLAANIPNATLNLIEDESHIGVHVNYETQIMDAAIKLLKS